MKRNIRIAAALAACAVTLSGCYVMPYDHEGKPFPVYDIPAQSGIGIGMLVPDRFG